MEKLFKKRQKITCVIESIIADLELRERAIVGDKIAIKVMQETRKEKQETLLRHIKNLSEIAQFIREQFEVINSLKKNN